ncbi:hypothetical protein BT96DRAFT_1019394 [Gymnopus androsaceus JB14]|uniref:RING-type domain-containing protein n=1 Tax=Gymnopus androsaceus JB14 TaxID=1447944 RepID=A0A6A4HPE6_9AGAR|nr:hypothetical protein BT96DRAFT_1019394 [Gymnopus androsaceus JB14]
MLVVDPRSTCDICLEPYEWDNYLRTPHVIDCGHVFCAQCLHQVFPTKCPMCRKVFLPSEVHKLHIECEASDAQKEEDSEMDLLKHLVLAYDSTEEEILRLRIRVDAWLGAREFNEQSPLRRARDALENYQQLKQKRMHDRRKIKTLEKAAREWEKSYSQAATRKQAEAEIMEQALRSQVAEHQAQITQLRAEIDKRQLLLDRGKIKKTVPPRPLPLPKAPLSIANPLPSPPRLVQITTTKPTWITTWDETVRIDSGRQPARFPIYEQDDDFDSEDNAAYFTCRTAPYAWLDEDNIADEPLLQRPIAVRNIYN